MRRPSHPVGERPFGQVLRGGVALTSTPSAEVPLRIGIVGCGGISERHGPAAVTSSDVAIVACCDVRVDAAERWRDRYGCERAYGDYGAMIREHDLDAVLLATWPVQHHEQVLGCLEAGVSRILCEKSLAVTAGEALEIWAAAGEAEALVVEGLMYRHHPAIRELDKLLAAGAIGDVDSIHASFTLLDREESASDDPQRDWRQRQECGGGVPFDLACYCVDACNHFAGSLPRQAVALTSPSERYGTVSRLFGLVEYENGVVGIVASSKRGDFDHELKISGSTGHLALPVAWRIDSPTEISLDRSVGWGEFETTRFPAPAVDVFRLQLEHFAAAARGQIVPVPSLAESAIGVCTLDALLTSAAQRAAVPVDIPDALRADHAASSQLPEPSSTHSR